MFEHTAIDGSSSSIPGQNMDATGEGYDVDGNGATPTTNNNKRTNSSNTCASSPYKKGKSPMVKIMREIRDTMQSNSAVAKKVMEGEYRSESIKKAMRLVVESGAAEGSVEHYMATKLFVKAENRDIFFTFETNDGRIAWLKRNCQDYGMYR
ncbi:hypothetical protein GUJ93_ZPchr0004g38789 [Zizania palustris]|uniref:Uncharacterized protein n=1 Tax=Zizania palustris TaxID=103762 RepID=A0A8J5SJ82_ZIZPA|nr:hypothetical protein GUJ93_ZPchr0004g38789 [Zizania palustris]